MEGLASKRIGHQNGKSHLQRKLEMEQRKVDAIQTELEKTLKELEVCFFFLVLHIIEYYLL